MSTDNLSGDPNVTAVYNSPDGKTPLALVALNIASPGLAPATTVTMSTSASFSFDVATLQSGKLLVGLLDPVNSGAAFTSLHFSVTREGATVEDQTFATPAAATTYFNDHVLDFGALKAGVTGTLDLTFLLEMTTLDNGARYGANFLVADVGLVGVPGDYNDDGKVDAADYVVWRFDPAGHGGTPGGYNTWRANFRRPWQRIGCHWIRKCVSARTRHGDRHSHCFTFAGRVHATVRKLEANGGARG